jgi:serine/threonine-protein kinase RsbW
MDSAAEEVRLVVPSTIQSLALINSVAEEVSGQMGFDEEARNAITISVIEAGTNAIQHGNGEDSSKPTEVLFRKESDRLTVVVRDQGRGFDPANLKDPLAKENMFSASGRGIYILRSFMDEVDFRFASQNGGTECLLVKYLPR